MEIVLIIIILSLVLLSIIISLVYIHRATKIGEMESIFFRARLNGNDTAESNQNNGLRVLSKMQKSQQCVRIPQYQLDDAWIETAELAARLSRSSLDK